MAVSKVDIEQDIAQKAADNNRQRILLPNLSVELVTKQASDRVAVERFIANHFYKSHKAELDTFLPNILTSRTKKNITSTVGFRLGTSSERFFLEQYFNNDAEHILNELSDKPVVREKLAEIGNLTSSYPGASQMLFVLIVAVLYEAGFEWALFTVTPQVQKMVDDLGIVSHEICDANPDALDDKGESWGGYYKNRPKVIAGNLKDAFDKLQNHPVASFMMCNYQYTTNTIAEQIR